jgi:hypothetical protein
VMWLYIEAEERSMVQYCACRIGRSLFCFEFGSVRVHILQVCVLMYARDNMSPIPNATSKAHLFSSPHQPPLHQQHKEKDSNSDARQAYNFCAQCATWCNVMITRAYISPSSRSPVLRGPVMFRSSYYLFIVAHSRYPRKPKRFGCMVGTAHA